MRKRLTLRKLESDWASRALVSKTHNQGPDCQSPPIGQPPEDLLDVSTVEFEVVQKAFLSAVEAERETDSVYGERTDWRFRIRGFKDLSANLADGRILICPSRSFAFEDTYVIPKVSSQY